MRTKASEAGTRFPLTSSVIAAGLAARAYPAAAIEVGRADARLWNAAFGRLTYDADAAETTPGTIFDLASLTKVIATTSFVMRLVEAEQLRLDDAIDARVPWLDSRRDGRITLRHLLDHSSGLPAHARLWEHLRGRAAYQEAIARVDLERPPGETSVYSDLGFILLGFLLEDVAGPLPDQMAQLANALGTETLVFTPPAARRPIVAPTEFDVWRNRLLVGDAHDENAAALDGVAGHAGLFGHAADVGTFARTVLRTYRESTILGSPATMRMFATITGVPESSRALGWDTMRPTSSCGSRLSPRAIGHTGFTGTSLSIDPELDLYVVFLTNRVHPTRANEALRALRPKVHEAVGEDLR